MRFRIVLYVLACGLYVAAVGASEEAGGYRLLQTGLFHGDEVGALGEETWWGLFPSGDGFELRACRPEFGTAHDAIVDLPGEQTGIEIRVPGSERPLVLIAGLANPAPGPVPTYFSGRLFLFPGDQRTFGSGHSTFVTVAALGRADETEYGPAILDYELKIYRRDGAGNVRAQSLAAFDGVSVDGRPELLWSGDVDRDGLPDFLFDLTDHYNMSRLALYLSSAAHADEIGGLAAEFVTTGC